MRFRVRLLAWLSYLALAGVAGWYGWVMLGRPDYYATQAYENQQIQDVIEAAVSKGAIAIQPDGHVGFDRSRIPAWCRDAVERYIVRGYIRAHQGEIIVEENLARRQNPHSGSKSSAVFLRGTIFDRKGVALAASEIQSFRPTRQWYDKEAFSMLLGRSDARFGGFGLEASCQPILASRASPVIDRLRQFQMKEVRGRSVQTTLDAELQVAAFHALTGYSGAAVVIEVASGAILAAASTPTLALDSPPREWFTERDKGEHGALCHRALDGLYPPGSTFKLIVAAAALESGLIQPEQTFICRGSYRPLADASFAIQDHERRQDFNWPGHNPDGATHFTGREAFAESCNCVFAQLGVQLGQSSLTQWARKFGFGEPIEILTAPSLRPLTGAPSIVWSAMGDRERAAGRGAGRITATHIAQSAIGQFEVRATTLQMAVATAIVANGGRQVTPRILRDNPESSLPLFGATLLSAPDPELAPEVISLSTARVLQDWMRAVTEFGTARALGWAGLSVAGKTGTAQNIGQPHGWFIGFAPAENPEIALAIVIEHGGYGSQSAVPAAEIILKAWLKIKTAQAMTP